MGTKNKPAGFWIRLLAYLIDGIILSLPFSWLSYALYGTIDFEQAPPLYLTFGLVSTLYFIILPVTSLQASLGKLLLGMKITDTNGDRIKGGKATGRFFSHILSYILVFIGYLMIGFTRRKTGLHDLIAGTYVVYRNK